MIKIILKPVLSLGFGLCLSRVKIINFNLSQKLKQWDQGTMQHLVRVPVRFQKFVLVQSLSSKFSSNHRVAGVQRLNWPTWIQDDQVETSFSIYSWTSKDLKPRWWISTNFRNSCFIIFQYGMIWSIPYAPYRMFIFNSGLITIFSGSGFSDIDKNGVMSCSNNFQVNKTWI